MEDRKIWEWWNKQNFQKESGEQEYTMIFEIDLPKIINKFLEDNPQPDWQSVAEKLADALENLVAEQNGAPVERYRDDWEEAMLKAESAFNEYKKLKR